MGKMMINHRSLGYPISGQTHLRIEVFVFPWRCCCVFFAPWIYDNPHRRQSQKEQNSQGEVPDHPVNWNLQVPIGVQYVFPQHGNKGDQRWSKQIWMAGFLHVYSMSMSTVTLKSHSFIGQIPHHHGCGCCRWVFKATTSMTFHVFALRESWKLEGSWITLW